MFAALNRRLFRLFLLLARISTGGAGAGAYYCHRGDCTIAPPLSIHKTAMGFRMAENPEGAARSAICQSVRFIVTAIRG